MIGEIIQIQISVDSKEDMRADINIYALTDKGCIYSKNNTSNIWKVEYEPSYYKPISSEDMKECEVDSPEEIEIKKKKEIAAKKKSDDEDIISIKKILIAWVIVIGIVSLLIFYSLE